MQLQHEVTLLHGVSLAADDDATEPITVANSNAAAAAAAAMEAVEEAETEYV